MSDTPTTANHANYFDPPKFSSVHEVTYYQARCTECGRVEDDYGDFSAWGDPEMPHEVVTSHSDWFSPHRVGFVVLLCPDCQRCEVCGNEQAYEVGDHLVCDEHEDHDFAETGCSAHGGSGTCAIGIADINCSRCQTALAVTRG